VGTLIVGVIHMKKGFKTSALEVAGIFATALHFVNLSR